jgi:hypothetical protein
VPSALRYVTPTKATVLNLLTFRIAISFCMDTLWAKTRSASRLSDTFFHFFSMTWRTQVGIERARRGEGLITHYTKHKPCQGRGRG